MAILYDPLMPNYRRASIPGGTFFFTLVTNGRRRFLCTPHARKILREAILECRAERPFQINAMVLLPDHLHAIWSLPRGDTDYSKRWGIIKSIFTKNWLNSGGSESSISEARQKEHRRGVWQPRFWEHIIEDGDDFERHFDYIHFNPVKHKLVRSLCEWEWSTFHRWVREGVYPQHWGCWSDTDKLLNFTDIEDTVGE